MDEMSVSKVGDLYKTYIAEKWNSLMVQEVVVTEKIIAKETLTKEIIDAGANVLRHLIKRILIFRRRCGSTGWNQILGVLFSLCPK